jgi:hypothetical protein
MKLGGEYWLKAKTGSLWLNTRKTNKPPCSRCTNGVNEDFFHMFWKCPNNLENLHIKDKLNALWNILRNDIIVYQNKPNSIQDASDQYLLDTTHYLLSDNCYGKIAKFTGETVEKIYKSRPEMAIT